MITLRIVWAAFLGAAFVGAFALIDGHVTLFALGFAYAWAYLLGRGTRRPF